MNRIIQKLQMKNDRWAKANKIERFWLGLTFRGFTEMDEIILANYYLDKIKFVLERRKE